MVFSLVFEFSDHRGNHHLFYIIKKIVFPFTTFPVYRNLIGNLKYFCKQFYNLIINEMYQVNNQEEHVLAIPSQRTRSLHPENIRKP